MKAIINPDGVTCTTVNPLGEQPELFKGDENCSWNFWQNSLVKWKQAEAERKTYEIESNGWVEHGFRFVPGTVHEIEIVNGKAIIK